MIHQLTQLTQLTCHTQIWSAYFSGDQSAAARLALKQLLSAQQIGTNQNSSVRLNQRHFPYRTYNNQAVCFSHSINRVLIALAPPDTRQLGVDTELKAVSHAVATRFFSEAEVRLLNQLMQNAAPALNLDSLRQTLWMAKEAYAKASQTELLSALKTDHSAVLECLLRASKYAPNNHASQPWSVKLDSLRYSGDLQQQWVCCAN